MITAGEDIQGRALPRSLQNEEVYYMMWNVYKSKATSIIFLLLFISAPLESIFLRYDGRGHGRREVDPISIVYLGKWTRATNQNTLPDMGYFPPTKLMQGLRAVLC
jgi:hypothetical protein